MLVIYVICLCTHFTTAKRHSFVGGFKFVGTDEYIQIIFIGFETDEYNFIFAG
jgi:hypothetical protein